MSFYQTLELYHTFKIFAGVFEKSACRYKFWVFHNYAWMSEMANLASTWRCWVKCDAFKRVFFISWVSLSLNKDGPIQIKKTIHKRSLDSMNYWQHEDVQAVQDDIQRKLKIVFHSLESSHFDAWELVNLIISIGKIFFF